MPCLRIETTRGWLEGSSEALFDRIDAVLCQVLKVPPNDSDTPERIPQGEMRLPAKSGQRYVFIEVALFAGRSLQTKRALYDRLTQVMADSGAAVGDVTIALHEVALENWGIEDGKSASDIAFGFTIAI